MFESIYLLDFSKFSIRMEWFVNLCHLKWGNIPTSSNLESAFANFFVTPCHNQNCKCNLNSSPVYEERNKFCHDMYLNDASSIPMCSKWRRNSNQELDLINRWEYLAYPSLRGVCCNEGYLDCCIAWYLCFMTHTASVLQRGAESEAWLETREGLLSLSRCAVSVSRDTGHLGADHCWCAQLPGIAISSLACLQHIPFSDSQSQAGGIGSELR